MAERPTTFLTPLFNLNQKRRSDFLVDKAAWLKPLYFLFGLDTCYATSGHWRVGHGYLAGQFDNLWHLLCGKCGRSKVLAWKAFSFAIFSSTFLCLGHTVTFTWCMSTSPGVVVFFFFPLKNGIM